MDSSENWLVHRLGFVDDWERLFANWIKTNKFDHWSLKSGFKVSGHNIRGKCTYIASGNGSMFCLFVYAWMLFSTWMLHFWDTCLGRLLLFYSINNEAMHKRTKWNKLNLNTTNCRCGSMHEQTDQVPKVRQQWLMGFWPFETKLSSQAYAPVYSLWTW